MRLVITKNPKIWKYIKFMYLILLSKLYLFYTILMFQGSNLQKPFYNFLL
jgi:hypothetical protein